MCLLEDYILNLIKFLVADTPHNVSIIRIHTRKLEQLGELSFPITIKNWFHLIDQNKMRQNSITSILQYSTEKVDLKEQISILREKSKHNLIDLKSTTIKGNDLHLFLQRSSSLYQTVISDVLCKKDTFGSNNIFDFLIDANCDSNIQDIEFSNMDLSSLRLLELQKVARNFLKFTSINESQLHSTITFTLSSQNKNHKSILCGPVLNQKGSKDGATTAQVLFEKRTLDMRLMAQHRYKVEVVPNTPREDYFMKIVKKLGKACVTIEMLSNKPHKPLKVSLNDLQTANKGAAFIFYNCARLSVLLKEFDRKVLKGMYPGLPSVNDVDFSLLNQPEEWELFYVYILQFPMVIKSCIKDFLDTIFNPQYLVTFLSNLSSLFSTYYRRVRILTDPREHLHGILHARICLLKALQVVFHNSLSLLNIEPIKEM